MTRIVLDPTELTAVAGSLRTIAAETAEVGTELRACVGCPMPPVIEAQVNQLVATADLILDELARRIGNSATELTLRAMLAIVDSLTGAQGASVAGLVLPAAAAPVAPTPFRADMSIVGGPSSADFSPRTDPTSFRADMSIVGGPTANTGTFGMGSAFRALSEASANSEARVRTQIANIMNDPSSTPGQQMVATNATYQLGRSNGMAVLPSRSDLERAQSRPISLTEFESMNTGGFNGIVGGGIDAAGLLGPLAAG